MNRLTKLLDHLPELLRRDAAGEPSPFPALESAAVRALPRPHLASKPWYEPAEFPWTQRFADHHAQIRAELEAFLAQRAVTFRNYVGPILHETADAGEWHVLYLDYRGHLWDDHCKMFPTLMKLAAEVPRRSGTLFISRLTPGAHIPKHCGATNTQLTAHFGIVVPEDGGGVELRVCREVRRQVEGQCSVFDDSFEHEVWNRSAHVRYNVFMQFWHPALGDDEIAGIRKLEQLPQIQGVIEKYLEGASALAPVAN